MVLRVERTLSPLVCAVYVTLSPLRSSVHVMLVLPATWMGRLQSPTRRTRVSSPLTAPSVRFTFRSRMPRPVFLILKL
uniref:Uncharacterized protein n=1 Tax=Ixodes ricinus TaxID=34613 RepID=A0A6B0U515_IXORI